jgi:TPP-dependent pyruvate/acetoin dehydrogenase alpha subunit
MSRQYTEEERENAYRQMALIRSIEGSFLSQFSDGRIKGTVHTCLGQEACAVGVLRCIDAELDVVFSSHRAHGHYLAYGAPARGLVAEVMGMADGVCGGIGGTQHLHWKNFYTNGIQGGMIPSAVGAALAEKMKKSNAISVVFIGDGTMGQGNVYECFNLAILWKLPLLIVLENNCFAQSTPTARAQFGALHKRALGFGIRAEVCNGNDVELVSAASRRIVDEVRATCSPVLLELETYRLGPHSKGDDTRTEDEIAPYRARDPLQITGSKLRSGMKELIDREVRNQVELLFQSVIAGN